MNAPNLPLERPGGTVRRRFSRARITGGSLVVLGFVATAGWQWAAGRLDGSLPRLEGEVTVSGIQSPVTIDRDALGVPRIQGRTRPDVAFATGFVHAQDRFFQMDLLRRRPAGETAALVGEAGVEQDRLLRRYRLRDRARRALGELSSHELRVVESYVAGVNAGLGDLRSPPWEYLLLGVEPEPWKPEDTLLAVLCMFTYLQDWAGVYEAHLSLLRDHLPEDLFHFLAPRVTRFDVPIAGELGAPLPVPGPDVFDLRAERPAPGERRIADLGAESGRRDQELGGSNAWAVAGSHTPHGGAILANDLHLGLSVPNLWYRVDLSWDRTGAGSSRVVGVTLPGTPAVVVGSNGRVAWGFTNSLADASDLVWVETLEDDPDRYRAPGGALRFARHREVIEVRDADAIELEVVETVWGPLVGEDHAGRTLAQRWVVQEPGAVNLEILGLEAAQDVDDAVAVANRAGLPAQNFLIADAGGRVAWTIAGLLPRRSGFDGTVPGSWADGSRRWEGRLSPDAYPRVVDPEAGRLWSANNRMVGGEGLAAIGLEGYALAARARQIHDRLLELESASPGRMLAIQLDHRALLWEPWRALVLESLTPEVVERDPLYAQFRRFVEAWDGLAAPDSVGFRLVRAFRLNVAHAVLDPLTVFEGVAAPETGYMGAVLEHEEPLRSLVESRPAHLLDPVYASWQELFVGAVDETLTRLGATDGSLEDKTWGSINATSIRHPFSEAIPFVDRWLDMPRQELPGSYDVPRVQSPGSGASIRLAVSPGREDEGYLHMPGGQSAHPGSPHYRDSHAAWAAGEPTPLTAGPAVHTVRLVPAGAAVE